MAKRLVDDVEHLAAILFLAEYLTALGVHGVQVIALHDHLSDLAELLGHAFLGHDEFVLHVVVVLDKSAQLFNMLRVVRVVVDGGHGAQLVEAFYQHALRVHVGESQRTDYLCHALLAAPLFCGTEQRS